MPWYIFVGRVLAASPVWLVGCLLGPVGVCLGSCEWADVGRLLAAAWRLEHLDGERPWKG